VWVSLKRRKGVSNDVDEGVRKQHRLDRLGGKPGLIDVKFSVNHLEFRRRHWQRSSPISFPWNSAYPKTESLIAHAIGHKPAKKNDNVMDRAGGGFARGRQRGQAHSHRFTCLSFVIVVPEFPYQV